MKQKYKRKCTQHERQMHAAFAHQIRTEIEQRRKELADLEVVEAYHLHAIELLEKQKPATAD